MRVYAEGQLALQSVDLIEDFDEHCYDIRIENHTDLVLQQLNIRSTW